MSIVKTLDPVATVQGKLRGDSTGYFYIRNGKQFYRSCEEGYQKNQSARQKWNSAAFAYAHKELHAIEADAELTAKMEEEYKVAKHKALNGKVYTTAHAWKFNSLLHEWKETHPFEM